MKGNREYKSDVFSMLMEDPKNALELYNAMNGSSYTDPDLVEINTLDKGISLTVRNDASFVLDLHLSIYEHQSSVCPNMPIRSLIYFSNILEGMIKGRNIYGRRLVKIPTPHFAVFYNGDEEQPEVYEQRLSDTFEHPVDRPEAELVCTIYNINYGKNKELLEKCSFLREYMIFIDYVRAFYRDNDYNDLGDCIERAIDRCIEENALREFLIRHRSEVVKVTKLDYTFDRQITLERIESREEGFAEGREEGRAEGREEGLAEGREEGLAEGREEGREEGLAEGREKGLAEGRVEGFAEGEKRGLKAGRAEGEIRKTIQIICKKVNNQKSLKQTAQEMEERLEDIRPLYDIIQSCAPNFDEDQIYQTYLENVCGKV